jgi:hypothetical protein
MEIPDANLTVVCLINSIPICCLDPLGYSIYILNEYNIGTLLKILLVIKLYLHLYLDFKHASFSKNLSCL